MEVVSASVTELVKISKIIVFLSDGYDNEESAKGCYDLHGIFKAQVRDIYIKYSMPMNVMNYLIKVSRDLRDERIAEIVDMHRTEEGDDEE